MKQLTKEHFDASLGTLEKNLSTQTEELARMVKKGFDSTDEKFAAATAQLTDISEKVDVRAELNQLQLEVKTMKGTIGQALQVEL